MAGSHTWAQNKDANTAAVSGVTSICATTTGLWSEGRGVIHTPRAGQMFFLPQQPFMPLGTLRQQLLFPSGTLLLTLAHGSAGSLVTARGSVAWQVRSPSHCAARSAAHR
jgi:hypothetical protein